MSEDQLNQRRNWKAIAFPYEHFFPDNSSECHYCLTDKQAEILRGIIEPLSWSTRWWSDATVIDQNIIREFRDDIIRRLLMPCCDDDLIFRWTIDLVLESSDDGGTTWTPAPEDDPRTNSPQFPPMTGDDGDDKKCIAATGMAHLIKTQIADTMTDDMGVYDLQELIRDWTGLSINSGANIFQILITIATNQILALGILLIQAALSEPVYDTLKCIFYCRMGNDASFTQEQLEQVTSDIGEQIGGIATLFLQQLINLLGPVGLTNLARSGGATEGDCEACEGCGAPICPDNWIETPGIGIILERGDNYIIVESQIVSGHYYNTIQSNDKDNCCKIIEMQAIVGELSLGVAWATCGSASIDGSGLFALGTCVWLFQMDSYEPLTIKYIFEPC